MSFFIDNSMLDQMSPEDQWRAFPFGDPVDDVAHDEVPVRCRITMTVTRYPPRSHTEKMDATETMKKTA